MTLKRNRLRIWMWVWVDHAEGVLRQKNGRDHPCDDQTAGERCRLVHPCSLGLLMQRRGVHGRKSFQYHLRVLLDRQHVALGIWDRVVSVSATFA
jgi:hypothetical protein